jgi:hypothetical protein
LFFFFLSFFFFSFFFPTLSQQATSLKKSTTVRKQENIRRRSRTRSVSRIKSICTRGQLPFKRVSEVFDMHQQCWASAENFSIHSFLFPFVFLLCSTLCSFQQSISPNSIE